MKFPGGSACRRRRRVLLGTLALPPLLWAAALAILPTDRFRACVSERLSAASGRAVEIGGVRIGFLGGVWLREVRIGAPESPGDPWLLIRKAAIDVSLLQLLYGRVEPTRIDIEGLDLRVLRRRDGTLEISDLLAPAPRHGPAGATHEPPAEDEPGNGLAVAIRQGRLHVIDEPTASRLDFLDIEGRAECRGPLLVVEDLAGALNGGTFRFSGHLRKDAQLPSFSGRLTAERVALRDGMNALGYLIPVFSGSQAQLEGRLSLDLALAGEGQRRDVIDRTLHGAGRVQLDPILLDNSRLLAEFSRFVELPPKGRVGAVRSSFTVGGGKVTNDHLTIDVGRLPVVLTGSTGFDGRLDYRLRGDALTDKIPTRARNYLQELEIDIDSLADVRVEGTMDDMVVKVNGEAVAGDRAGTQAGQREKLREIGRRIRDRIRR